jgi:hypothetical protein
VLRLQNENDALAALATEASTRDEVLEPA